MQEIRIHGRGGQGVKIAARIISKALFLSGYQTQDFAIYGAERRGAPVTSFVRYDKKPILERGYIFEPDSVIVLDSTLNFGVMTSGLKENGILVVNSHKDGEFFRKKFKIKQKTYTIDATHIALKIMGKPITNSAMVGAFAKIKKINISILRKAIKEEIEKMTEQNIKTAEECYKVMAHEVEK